MADNIPDKSTLHGTGKAQAEDALDMVPDSIRPLGTNDDDDEGDGHWGSYSGLVRYIKQQGCHDDRIFVDASMTHVGWLKGTNYRTVFAGLTDEHRHDDPTKRRKIVLLALPWCGGQTDEKGQGGESIISECDVTDQCGVTGFHAALLINDWRLVDFTAYYDKTTNGEDLPGVWMRISEDLDN